MNLENFENEIDKINTWLIEFDAGGIPEREIGLDKDGKVVMIMPWKDNYGYWTDNNLNLTDFMNGFTYSEIENEYLCSGGWLCWFGNRFLFC